MPQVNTVSSLKNPYIVSANTVTYFTKIWVPFAGTCFLKIKEINRPNILQIGPAVCMIHVLTKRIHSNIRFKFE